MKKTKDLNIKKSIVFDCERMKYVNTGLYHYCLNLGKTLQQFVEDKEDLVFFSPPNITDEFGKDTMHLKQKSLQKFFLPRLNKHTIWHATYQHSNYIPIRNKKIKVVLTIHDLNFLYEKPFHKRKKYLNILQKNINRADAVTCISNFTAKDVLEHCSVGDKIFKVIYNGTNQLQDPNLLHESYVPSHPFLFCIGMINRKKNFKSLIPLIKKLENR